MPSALRSLPPPSKKRKIVRVDNAQSIKKLEEELTAAVAENLSLNPLADLLALAYSVEDPHDTSKAIYALYRVFVVIITNNKLGLGGDEAAKVVKAWIWERLQAYVDFLGGLLQDEEKFLRVSHEQYLAGARQFISIVDFCTTNYVFPAETPVDFIHQLIKPENTATSIPHLPLPKNRLSSAPVSFFDNKIFRDKCGFRPVDP